MGRVKGSRMPSSAADIDFRPGLEKEGQMEGADLRWSWSCLDVDRERERSLWRSSSCSVRTKRNEGD